MTTDSDPTYHDLHRLERSCGDIMPHVRCVQLDQGLPTIRHDKLDLGDVTLRRFQVSHSLLQEFDIRDGWTTLVLVYGMLEAAVWNGVRCVTNGIGVLRPSMDHEVKSPGGWSTIEIDIADHVLDREGPLPRKFLEDATSAEKGQLRLAPHAAGMAARSLASLFEGCAGHGFSGLKEDPVRAARRHVLDVVATTVDRGHVDGAVDGAARDYRAHHTVRRARDLVEERLRDHLPIETIALELGVSTRALQRSFYRVLGTSPKQYLLARKLDAARRTMRRRSRVAITQIAHEFGFVSSSRFSEQFRRHFGHAPSAMATPIPVRSGLRPLSRS